VLEEQSDMVSRILGVLIVTGSVFFGVFGMTHAQPVSATPVKRSAPELDPSALAGGIAILVGGVLVLNERRRSKQ